MMGRLSSLLPPLVFLVILFLRVSDPLILQQMRLFVFDTFQRMMPRSYDPRIPVRIVDVDQISQARYSQWPWPRSLIATLVERLADAGAAAIAFDIVLSEADRSSPEQALRLWPDTKEVRTLWNSVAALPAHDDLLAAAMKGAPVVTGFLLTQDGEATAVRSSSYGQRGLREASEIADAASTKPEASPIQMPAEKATFALGGDDPRPFLPRFKNAIVNLPTIEAASAGNGALNSLYELDRVTRKIPLVFGLNDKLYPSLLAETLRVAQGAQTNFIKASGSSGVEAFGEQTGLHAVRIGQLEIPTDSNGRVWGRFTKHAEERYLSAWKVLEDDFDPAQVAGKIIFIGTSMPGLHALQSTPLESSIPSVEIKAQIAEQIIAGDFLLRPGYADAVELAYMFVLGLFIIILLRRFGALTSLTIGCGTTVLVFWGSWIAFEHYQWMFDPTQPSLMVIFVFITGQGVSYMRSEKERIQADAANLAKSDFLSVMSHEIRTPMNAIVGMIELLGATRIDSEQKEMIAVVRESSATLLGIVDDILESSKIEAGKLNLEMVPLDLTDIVEGVASVMAPNANAKGIVFWTFVDPALPRTLIGDPMRLRQILLNLSGNAVKFTSTGSVQIRVDLVGPEEGGRVRLRIRVIDTGIGINNADQPKLFQPFQQADSTTTRRFGGTGLGLFICRRIAKLMAGDIGIDSALGQGATFWVDLVLEVARESSVDGPQPFDLRGLRVLMAASDVTAEFYRRYLEAAGAIVSTVASVEAAISEVEAGTTDSNPYEVVVVAEDFDDRISLEHGASAVRLTGLPEIRSVRVFRHRDDTNRERSRASGFSSFLTAPVRRDALLRAVAGVERRARNDTEATAKESDRAGTGREVPSAEHAFAQGRSILVADDHSTNRQVLVQQLKVLGFAADSVADGVEALAALDEKDYALLLTDWNMPNMDGIGLLQAIRERERDSDHRLPVIAVTANVLESDVASLMGAGMDDHLAKPVELSAMKRVLEAWIPDAESVADAMSPAQGEIRSNQDEAIDLSVLGGIFGDDAATLRNLVTDFVATTHTTREILGAALLDRSAEDLCKAAHKLKGSSHIAGASALAVAADAIETTGQGQDWNEIERLVADLDAKIEAVDDFVATLV